MRNEFCEKEPQKAQIKDNPVSDRRNYPTYTTYTYPGVVCIIAEGTLYILDSDVHYLNMVVTSFLQKCFIVAVRALESFYLVAFLMNALLMHAKLLGIVCPIAAEVANLISHTLVDEPNVFFEVSHEGISAATLLTHMVLRLHMHTFYVRFHPLF